MDLEDLAKWAESASPQMRTEAMRFEARNGHQAAVMILLELGTPITEDDIEAASQNEHRALAAWMRKMKN